MKETTKFDDFSGEKAISLAKTFAKDAYTKELGVVLSVAFSDIRNLPALGFNQDEPIPLKEYVEKWVSRYLSGCLLYTSAVTLIAAGKFPASPTPNTIRAAIK